MPRLQLSFLGAPRLERDGRPVEVDTRKAIALLAYLALTRERQARDKLAALFWPEADDSKAHAALRRTLSALNKALDGAGLEIEREAVAMAPDVWVDVDEFQRRAKEAHDLRALAEAAALYRDDFLSGFSLRDSPAFDDWQFFQAETLRRELMGVLERLAHAHAGRREFEPAITYARRWLALDPLDEPAHRHLMQLYAWAGQPAAAQRQYRECERLLQEELGVQPLDETTQLYQAIKEKRLALPERRSPLSDHRPAGGLPAGVSDQPAYPLVGRAAEMQRLLAAYAPGQFIVIEGEAGIGKTRLAEEFLAHAAQEDSIILRAHCYAGQAGLAYGPLVEAMRAALAQPRAAQQLAGLAAHHRAEVARLLPELGQARAPTEPAEGPGAQGRFLEALRQTLLALAVGAGPRPGVLFVDDAHWLDEASLDLLAYLVRRLHDQPLLIILTLRGEDVPATHRLRGLLAEAGRAGFAHHLTLARLSLTEVHELARSRVGGQHDNRSAAKQGPSAPSAQLAERLYRETEGSPFFVVEYLAAIASQPEADGEWPLPAGVRELLGARLARLGEAAGQLLSAAAVIGRSFDLDILQAVSGRSEDETVAGLEELLARGLVLEQARGPASVTFDFNHAKLRALVYEQTSLVRRRLLHRRVAEALVARERGQREAQTLAAQIAQHYRLSGREAEAADYFQRAGDQARALYANAEALALYRAALALGHPRAAALHEAIGDLLTLGGDYAGALTSYETSAATAPPDRLAALEHKLGNVYDRRGEWDLAESHFHAALAANGAHDPSAERARLYADWSRTAHHRGQTDHAHELAARALEQAEAAGDSRALAQAHNILGLLASRQGAFAQARVHLEHSLRLAEVLRDPDARVAALNNLALACREDGDLPRALALTEEALAQCVSLGDRHREAALHNNLADLLHGLGQAEAAMQHLKQAAKLFAEVGAETGERAWQPEIWRLTEW